MKVFFHLSLGLAFLVFSVSINTYKLDWLGIPKSGTISGQVLNIVDELPIAGAIVSVIKKGKRAATAITDSEGFFKIPGLTPATYNIVAEEFKFGSLKIDSVPVIAGNEVTTHFILTPLEPII